MLKIEVTQQDIDLGVVCSPCLCPVARAISRARGLPASVGAQLFHYLGTHESYHLPEEAQYFIGQFDAGRPVAPFTFEID